MTLNQIIEHIGVEPYYREDAGVIYNADCLEILPKMPEKCVDLVVTSPPYNLVKEHIGGGKKSNRKTFHKRMIEDWYNDSMPDAEYVKWQQRCLSEMRKVCAGSVFYNHKIRYAIKRRGKTYHPTEIVPAEDIYCEIIWRMPRPGLNVPRFKHVDERIYQLGIPVTWHNLGYETVWDLDFERNRNGHPCPFPVELPARCIRSCTDKNAIILDPMGGSGTSGVAAKRLERKYILIDTKVEYCQIAVQRLAQEILI